MLCEFEFLSPREVRRLGQLHGLGSSALCRLAAKIFFILTEFLGFSESFLTAVYMCVSEAVPVLPPALCSSEVI